MSTGSNPLAELAEAMQALASQPQNAQLWCTVGFLYLKIFELHEALDTFRAAQAMSPHLSDPWYGEAITQQQLGDTPAALQALRNAMQRNPQDQRLFSAYAYLTTAAGLGQETVLAAYRDWARRFAEPLKPKHRPPPNRRSAGEKLRIGYVSADFRQHALMDFFAPVLAHHDRQRFSLIAFSQGAPDERTPAIRSQFDFWNDIRGLSDQAVADLIRKRGIDILIDLSGHTEGNRLLAFARQPAAVQLTWYGYNGSTGMTAMDGRLTDPVMDPPEHVGESVEPLCRLPNFASFSPPDSAPLPSTAPCLQNGYITFGSLNNAQKLSDQTLSVWAALLGKLPTAHLVLIGPHAPTGGEVLQQTLLERLAKLGIPLDRTTLLPRQSLADFLQLGQYIDIALESFPLSGAVTTSQALWMGLPVITLAGSLPFERAAAAILAAANRPEWIAADTDQYLDLACQLAGDPAALNQTRLQQRTHLADTPLLNGAQQTQALEQIYLALWAQATRRP